MGRVVKAGLRRDQAGRARQVWWCYPDSDIARHRFLSPRAVSPPRGGSPERAEPWGRHPASTIALAIICVSEGRSVRETGRLLSTPAAVVSPRLVRHWLERFGPLVVDVLLNRQAVPPCVILMPLAPPKVSSLGLSAEDVLSKAHVSIWGVSATGGVWLDRVRPRHAAERLIRQHARDGLLREVTFPLGWGWESTDNLAQWSRWGVSLSVEWRSVDDFLALAAHECAPVSQSRWAVEELRESIASRRSWASLTSSVSQALPARVLAWHQQLSSYCSIAHSTDAERTRSLTRSLVGQARTQSSPTDPDRSVIVQDLTTLAASGRLGEALVQLLIEAKLAGLDASALTKD